MVQDGLDKDQSFKNTWSRIHGSSGELHETAELGSKTEEPEKEPVKRKRLRGTLSQINHRRKMKA